MQGEPAVHHQEEEEEEAAGFIGELAEEVEKWGSGRDSAAVREARQQAGARALAKAREAQAKIAAAEAENLSLRSRLAAASPAVVSPQSFQSALGFDTPRPVVPGSGATAGVPVPSPAPVQSAAERLAARQAAFAAEEAELEADANNR